MYCLQRGEVFLRQQLKHQIDSINQNILRLGTMIEESLWTATQALIDSDMRKAQSVLDNKEEMASFKSDLITKVLTSIATEHPIATDLQNLMSGIRVIFELERMADYCGHMATAVIELGTEQRRYPSGSVRKISESCILLLRQVLSDFLHKTDRNQQEALRESQKIKDLIGALRYKLKQKMKEDPQYVDQCLTVYSMISSLEGFGNRTVNIASEIHIMR